MSSSLVQIKCCVRLHREVLKQSATDPFSDKIDVGILTTGLSTAARKMQADLVASVKDNLKKKGNVPTVSWQKLFMEIKEDSQVLITREQFEDADALKVIQDDDVIVVSGMTTINLRIENSESNAISKNPRIYVFS